MRKRILATAALGLSLAALTARAAGGDWPTYQRDAARSGSAELLRPPLAPAWTFALPSSGWTFASAVAADGSVYVGTLGGDLLALGEDGVERWRYRAGGAIHMAAAVSSGTVVLGSAEGEVAALDAATGAKRWGYRVGSNVHSSPNVVDGVVYVGANDGAVYALALDDGRLLWRRELGGYVWASPAADAVAVYAATLDGKIAALARTDGHPLWESSLPGAVRASPVLSGAAVAVGDDEGHLRALRASDGAQLWSFDAGSPVVGAAAAGFVTYAATLDGKLRAFDASGAASWTFDAGAEAHAPPTIHGGVAALGADDRGLYLIGVSSGALISRVELGGRAAGPAVSARGRLYASSDDGVLAAYDSANAPPSAPAAATSSGTVLSWVFEDPDAGDRQTAFQVQVTTSGYVSASDTGIVLSTSSSYAFDPAAPEGRYDWRVRTYDSFGSSSPFTGGAPFLIDRTAPLVVLRSPRAGDRYLAGAGPVTVDFQVSDALDPAPSYAAELVELEDRGGPRGTRPDRIAVSSSAAIDPGSLDDGLWRLEVTATDSSGNSISTATGSFEIVSDVLPPRTALALGVPQAGSAPVVVGGATPVVLSSVDDLAAAGDGAGFGVARQTALLDGVLRSTFTNAAPAPGAVFISTLTLAGAADGVHVVGYFAEDVYGASETARAATVAVDNTAPRSSLARSGGRESGAYVSADAEFSLSAADPLAGGVAAGVAESRLSVDGGPFAASSAAFSLPEGAHELAFASVDRVDNLEAAASTAVFVDATAPVSTAAVGAPAFAGGTLYLSPATPVALSAYDPVLAGTSVAGSGLARIEASVDGGTYAVYASSLTFAPGARELRFRAADNVGNVETEKTLAFTVDGEAPSTSLLINGAAGGAILVSTDSVSFAAVDAGAGVASTLYSIDGSSEQAYGSPFVLAAGSHVLSFRSLDALGNAETARTASLQVFVYDVDPPALAVAPVDRSTVTTASPRVVADYSDAGRGVDPSSVRVTLDGVDVTSQAFVTASSATFVPAADLTQGAHTVVIEVADQAGVRASIVSRFFLDSIAPVTALLINGQPSSASLLVSTETISFAASDGGTGVAGTFYTLDGGAEAPFAAAFHLQAGTHTVVYRSVDAAGNAETPRAASFEVRGPDTAAPQLTLSPVDGSTTTAAPVLTAAYSDAETGIDTASVRLFLDGVDVTSAASVSASSASYAPASLAEGAHEFAASVADRAANTATASSRFFLDSVAPATLLLVDGLPASATAFVAVSTDAFGFAAADAGTGVADTLYSLDGGAESVFVSTFSLAPGTHVVSYRSVDRAGNAEAARSASVAVRAPDAAAPSLSLTPVDGSTTTSSTPEIVAAYQDAGTGVDLASFRLSVDGVDVTALAAVGASSASYVPAAALSQGTHTVAATVADRAANAASASSRFLVDGLAPVTALLVNGLPAAPAIVSTDTVSFAAADAGAGVAETFYSLDGGSEVLYISTFSLQAGTRTLAYRSIDRAGNAETARTATLIVSAPDAAAPLLTLSAIDGSTVTAASFLAAHFSDTGTGVDAASLRLLLDGVDVTSAASVFASSAIYASGAIADGAHEFSASVADRSGNAASASARFFLDSAAPATVLLVDGLPASSTALVLVSTDALGFAATDAGTGVADTFFSLDGGAESVFVSTFSLPPGTHAVSYRSVDRAGNAEAARSASVSVRAPDAGAPSLTLTPVDGSTTTVVPLLAASYSDAETGVDAASVRLSLDGVDVTSAASVSASSASYVPASLAEGAHVFAASAADRSGNFASASSRFFLDSIAPVTTVLVDGLAVSATSLTIASTDTIGFSASDAGTGAASTRFSLDGGAETVYLSTFALSVGTRSVSYRSLDAAGNAEASRAILFVVRAPEAPVVLTAITVSPSSATLGAGATAQFAAVGGYSDGSSRALSVSWSVEPSSVASVDAGGLVTAAAAGTASVVASSGPISGRAFLIVTAPVSSGPAVALTYPSPSALDVERAVGGVVNVRGSVAAGAGVTWILESAPGAGASSGFTAIASGAGGASGVLAAWNTTALSGYRTLRLSASAPGGASSTTATVFVGNPVFAFAVGNKDSDVIVNKIKNPTGIAVRSDGSLWVAGTTDDRLVLLSPAGAFLLEAGEDGQGARHFQNPQGLAVDAADNLYVADKGRDRIVKLSPDGATVLLDLSRKNNQGKPVSGGGPGEFKEPWDVAVDVNGDIYAVDSGNDRIQVFNSSGAFLRQFGQAVFPHNADVRAVALSAEGVWVSDKESERVYLFARAGTLIKSIGDAESIVGEISRTRGLAVDRFGALLVVELNRDRTQKFDAQGKGMLSFGPKAQATEAEKAAKRYLTEPIDAALAPDGALWITDTGRDRLVRYELPAPSGGFGVAAAGRSAGGPSIVSSSVEPVKRLVDADDGAKVERDDGAGVTVPKGALSADLEITVEKGDENVDKTEKTAKRKELKIAAVSEEVQYGPEGTVFNAPVTLTLPYNAALLAAQGINEDSLKVYYWNPALKDWQAMPSTVNKANKTVSATTLHFSAYQVGGLGGVGVAAIDDFGMRDGYAFPNPSRGGESVTFRLQPGSVDSIEVRVYDTSGRQVHSSSDFRFRGAFDDGNGKGAQNTYDHAWDVSGVGSGVYSYVMTAKKAGENDIRKTGKVGVIK